MIPKADILVAAKELGLQQTIVEKDYVLGWVLWGIGGASKMAQWVLKGGTCLKKCFFETYRFSEDLDFTVPAAADVEVDLIREALEALSAEVHQESGIEFVTDRMRVEAYTNPRGNPSYRATLYYRGPLGHSSHSLQKIKFDITQDEILVEPPDSRAPHHPYRDTPGTKRRVRTYALEEQLAEKTRALYERQGRARDVYDVVHIFRNYSDEVDLDRARDIAVRKFAFKSLPAPTAAVVLGRVDHEIVRANWEQQLRRQLPALPDVDSFLAGLAVALEYLDRTAVAPALAPISKKVDERSVPRERYWQPTLGGGWGQLHAIRFAARNRLCVRLVYDGADRLVEPYSLRHPATGNLLLYVLQRTKNGRNEGGIRALNVAKIRQVRVTELPFRPSFPIEL